MGGEAGKEKILSRYKVVRHDLGGRGFSGDNFLCGAQNDEGGCHSARLGESDAEWIVNVWVKSMPCNPGTSTVLPSKRACVQRTAAFTDIRRIGARGVTALRRWSPPTTTTPYRRFHWGHRKSWGLLKDPCILLLSGGFKGESVRKSYGKASGTLYMSAGWKAWRKKKQRPAQWEAGCEVGKKLKEPTTSH